MLVGAGHSNEDDSDNIDSDDNGVSNVSTNSVKNINLSQFRQLKQAAILLYRNGIMKKIVAEISNDVEKKMSQGLGIEFERLEVYYRIFSELDSIDSEDLRDFLSDVAKSEVGSVLHGSLDIKVDKLLHDSTIISELNIFDLEALDKNIRAFGSTYLFKEAAFQVLSQQVAEQYGIEITPFIEYAKSLQQMEFMVDDEATLFAENLVETSEVAMRLCGSFEEKIEKIKEDAATVEGLDLENQVMLLSNLYIISATHIAKEIAQMKAAQNMSRKLGIDLYQLYKIVSFVQELEVGMSVDEVVDKLTTYPELLSILGGSNEEKARRILKDARKLQNLEITNQSKIIDNIKVGLFILCFLD